MTSRPKRTSLRRKRVLEAQPRDGYVRRWVNEEIGAIDAYKDVGWTPVAGDDADISDPRIQTESKLGSVVRRVVNRDPNASSKTAVLMEIPEAWYKEAQAEKQRDLDKIEAAIDPRKQADYGKFDKTYS